MSVRETYNKHKISHKRREFSSGVLKRLRTSREKRIREGEVYCIQYNNDEFPTDKWHAVGIVYVTEIGKDEIVGYNLLYLGDTVSLNLLEKAEEIETYRGSKLQLMVDQELTRTPWVHSRKAFRPEKIVAFVSIPREEWGMIPVMEKSLFGNLNHFFLTKDWVKENEDTKKAKKKKKEKEKLFGEEYVIEENEDVREVVFEERQDLTKGLPDIDLILDDDDA